MNKDTEYEKFTQEIYQGLINSQGIKTIEVQHNVELTGKSGQKHQIDVYWTYEIGEIKHSVAIECKNYKKSVSLGQVRDFYSVLSDLNNINGVMVTKVGYQSGTKKFADFYGINLKELRAPTKKDWKGRIKEIVFETILVQPYIKSRRHIVDQDWVKGNIELPKDGEKLVYTFGGMANEIILYNEVGEKITDFHELEQKVPHNWEAAENLEHTFFFDNAFLEVSPIGRIKIKGIQYIYDVITHTEEFKIDGTQTAKAILKDAITGEIKFFDKNGNIK